MISKKNLIAKLEKMNLDSVLFSANRRTANHRGYAAEIALASLIGVSTFGATSHTTKRGKLVSNPRWFAGLYTEVTWSAGDVTPGSILQALA